MLLVGEGDFKCHMTRTPQQSISHAPLGLTSTRYSNWPSKDSLNEAALPLSKGSMEEEVQRTGNLFAKMPHYLP